MAITSETKTTEKKSTNTKQKKVNYKDAAYKGGAILLNGLLFAAGGLLANSIARSMSTSTIGSVSANIIPIKKHG